MANIELLRPRSVDEAVDLLERSVGAATVLAGGVDVMAGYYAGLLRPRAVLYLGEAGLSGVQTTAQAITLGATTPLLRLAELGQPSNGAGAALAAAASRVGTRAIQIQATIGGHLFTRPPYGDLQTMLLALDARVRLRGAAGEREVSLDTFLRGNGETTLGPGELVTAVVVPNAPGHAGYERIALTRGIGPALLTAAAWVDRDADGRCRVARIAVGGAGPRPYRATRAEQALVGRALDDVALREAGALAAEQASPSDDTFASAWYRRKVAAVAVERALRAAQGA